MTPADRTDQRVRAIIAEMLVIAEERVIDGAKLGADLGADSLDALEIAMAIEEEIDIEFADDEVAAAATVGDVVALVRGKIGGKEAA